MLIWIITICLIPIAWLLQNAIHEGSHLLVGWLREGRKPISIHIFPHYYKERFFFARAMSGPATKEDPYGLRHASPVYANFIYALIILTLRYLYNINIMYVLPFILAYTIDNLWWFRGYLWGSSRCDGKKLRKS